MGRYSSLSPQRLHERLFCKLVLVSQSVLNGKRADSEQGSCRFSAGCIERNYVSAVGFSPSLLPHWRRCCWGYLWDAAWVDCASCWAQLMGTETLQACTEIDRFLLSLLKSACWPDFYNLSCLVLPLWKEDVFCNKRLSCFLTFRTTFLYCSLRKLAVVSPALALNM